MRSATAVLLVWAWAAVAASLPVEGDVLFWDCEFKAAVNSFEHALAKEPGNARLHFWLGKSYARMAEVSGPLSARRNARKAQAHLETAGRLDPGNREFLTELFDLYVDSPEYFDGGLNRAAAMIEQLGPDDGGPAAPSRIMAEARQRDRGPSWALQKGALRVAGAAGYLARCR